MSDETRLPRWAQQRIAELQRQRDTAIRALNEYVESQKESPIYIDELESTGEEQGPSKKRRYVHAHCVEFSWNKVHLSVTLRQEGLTLQWTTDNRATGDVAFVPCSFQNARLVHKDNMR